MKTALFCNDFEKRKKSDSKKKNGNIIYRSSLL